MGTFSKSFTREMGKNTGKAVSNLIFGDMHSTPYRRVGATQYREPRKSAAEMRHEREVERIEAEERLRRNQIEAENQRMRQEQLLSIDSAVLKNIDAVAGIRIPNDKDELLHLLSELSTQVKANKWHKNDEEGKIRNKFTDALFEKYQQCVLKLQSIAPFDPQTEYYENIANDIKKKKIRKKYGWLIGTGLFILVFVLVIINGILFDLNLLGAIVFGFISLLVIFAIFKGIKIVAKINKEKAKQAQRQNQAILQTNNTISQTQQKDINYQSVEQVVEDSIFIDLNENNRIESKLSGIWRKYANNVDSQIISRKPIFSADGVKDSILFVGVNPSYNPNDDKIFVHSADDKSLMYGSLYQLPDAPSYFKALEIFAEKAGKPYSHINLLYARENDRDLLLNCDHNFIREQLELTYETIKKINPVAIVFFTDYCKDLIYGADRWVNPASKLRESYILNGTNIPVFFTDDITTMDNNTQFSLVHKIGYVLSRRV